MTSRGNTATYAIVVSGDIYGPLALQHHHKVTNNHALYSFSCLQLLQLICQEKWTVLLSQFWPSDHYFRSVCLFVCLSVQSFSQPSLIRFRSN